jgi:hypothetical protein
MKVSGWLDAPGLSSKAEKLEDLANLLLCPAEFRVFVEAAERQLLLLFRSIDKNGDGKVGKEELRMAFKSAGLAVPGSRLDGFFNDIDMNNDGYISFDEWRYVYFHVQSQSLSSFSPYSPPLGFFFNPPWSHATSQDLAMVTMLGGSSGIFAWHVSRHLTECFRHAAYKGRQVPFVLSLLRWSFTRWLWTRHGSLFQCHELLTIL